MFQIIGQPITFIAFFSIGGVGTAGLPIKVDVIRINTDGSVSPVVTDEDANNSGGGFYSFTVADTDIAGQYCAKFRDTGGTADQLQFPAVWYVGMGWAQYVYQQAQRIAATSAPAAPESFSAFDGALKAETDCRFTPPPFRLEGFSIAGWTKLVFTIKESAANDDDPEALLVVRLSNPPNAGTDGILIHNRNVIGAGDAIRTKAALSVSETDPDATFSIVAEAEALNLPPSPDNAPFSYEVDVWYPGKEQIAKGEFAIRRSLRRNPVAP